MSINRRSLIKWSLLSAVLPWAAKAQASDKFLRIIVPFLPGGITDVCARALGSAMTQATGRTVVVDNKPGAASVIGSLELTRAKPDGNTIMLTTGGHTTNAALLPKLPYDSIAGFTPITLLVKSDGFALMVNAKSDFKNMPQLVAAAKASPGRYSYGSAGIGGTPHLFGALFAKSAGIDLLHVPFKGNPINDLLAGNIDVVFVPPTSIMTYIKSGKLRVLAQYGDKRSPQLADVPTFKELGIDTIDVPGWAGIFGPPGMAKNVVESVYGDIMRGAAEPQFPAQMNQLGSEVVGMPPAAFQAYVASEIARYKKVLPPLGIEIN